MGGLAAGITGSNVVGVSTAYQTEQKNQGEKQRQVASMIVMSNVVERKTNELSFLSNEISTFKNNHSDLYTDSTYINDLNIGNFIVTLHESGNLTVKGKAILKTDVSILQKPGVLDGSLKIICNIKDQTVAVGYYSAPGLDVLDIDKVGFGSNKGSVTEISALCYSKMDGQMIDVNAVSITVEPIQMWVINKNK